jgi:hypothetical protein
MTATDIDACGTIQVALLVSFGRQTVTRTIVIIIGASRSVSGLALATHMPQSADFASD